MKKNSKSKLGLIFATVGLIITCIDLIISKFQSRSIILFCCLITIWICELDNYKKITKVKRIKRCKRWEC